jgi:ectoine hydroxylase-related dioxygenase (phytanoyl-CoA dioxygenase family)
MTAAIQFERDEIQCGAWRADKLATTYERFKTNGCLWLKDVLPPVGLNEISKEILGNDKDPSGHNVGDYSHAQEVGKNRFMVPIVVQGALNNPSIYAHPLICSILKRALGEDFRLGGIGVVISLPGAPDQHVHRDHPALFGTAIDDFLPSFAVTVIIPLVDLDGNSGTTRMWHGSHLARYHLSNSETDFGKRKYEDPYASVGDCLLMDYRLYHSGLANRTDRIRPILYLSYTRPWFRDYVNYHKHAPLLISNEEFERLPLELRPLFANALIQSKSCDFA